jgi:uroporphyrinogen-III decarboxylase
MYQRPEKLMALCEKLWEFQKMKANPAGPKTRGQSNRIHITIHWGADNFMSKKQFETFYWPALKKPILINIDLGYTPVLYAEGKSDERIEYLRDLPKGKVVAYLHDVNMARAKEILGGHLCLMGNVSPSLLQTGSADDMEKYCKELIKVCGKEGGFILATRGSMDFAKPANVKAMVDSVKKYGRY